MYCTPKTFILPDRQVKSGQTIKIYRVHVVVTALLERKLVRDTRKSERHELIRVVFWNNPCSTSDYSLHFISFLTVRGYSNIFMSACLRSQLLRENRIRVVFYHAYT